MLVVWNVYYPPPTPHLLALFRQSLISGLLPFLFSYAQFLSSIFQPLSPFFRARLKAPEPFPLYCFSPLTSYGLPAIFLTPYFLMTP